MHIIKKVGVAVLLLLANIFAYSQKMSDLSLTDMSSFKSQDGNWLIVGDVSMDRNINVHDNGNGSVVTKPGSGVLVNLNDEKKRSALLSSWEHGDMEIELEFMMPKGSNSGLYLQGRYEVQLFDSWGVKNPKFSDLGGIYRNWESEKGKIYMGKAPLANPAKAPGLWQKMFISFLAPRFDAAGKKTENAKIKIAKINGVTIHENLEIPLPTGGPISNEEVAKGPIMIQGDHGAVAFKNIKYRLMEAKPIPVTNVQYKYWKGTYAHEDDFKNLMPTKSGKSADGITWEMSEVKDYFAIHLTGDIEVPFTDQYSFDYKSNGNLAFLIDGQSVLKNIKAWDWDNLKSNPLNLSAGKHKFDVYYSRTDAWIDPNLGIFVQSDKLARTPLHNFSSYKVRQALAPIVVKVKEQPKILRAFLDYNNDRNLRRTHTIGVGDLTGINYVFDNDLGAISCIWKGEFVDATPMWNDRGDGSFKPIGDVIFLDNTPQLDVLQNDNTAFSLEYKEEEFKPRGYKINEDSGTPIYTYKVKEMEVSDECTTNAVSQSFNRSITIKNKSANAKFRIAKGANIKKLDDGSYVVDGKYYITTDDSTAYIRSSNGHQELVSNIPNDKVSYSLIW